jgi:endonuclease YncB( thermonuclease family)
MKNLIYRTAVLLLTLTVYVSVLAQSMVFQGRVVDVIDGTTVIVLTKTNSEFRVTCRSIKASGETQTSAAESRQRLSDLSLGKPVTVEYETNANGNLVGLILVDQSNVCLDQVKAGLASYDREHANEQSSSDRRIYTEAESVARYRRTGMWNDASTASGTGSGENSASPSVVVAGSGSLDQVVNVRGYFRKDGTYVAPHKRTGPDGNFENNWTTSGNSNPFTGEVGTRKTSRWKTAFKWIGLGATLGALLYLDARYSSLPAGATAICNDGTYSYSRHRRGTCSWHGGVRRWLY